MSSFFAMGGSGYYIWTAYGVTALVVALELYALRARRKAALAQARDGGNDDGAVGAAS